MENKDLRQLPKAYELKNKSDQVVDIVIDMILRETLRPNERLPVEAKLAESFGVSRITVREAFKKLSTMGIVDVRQGDGTYITNLEPSFYMRPLLPMMAMRPRNMADLYDARLAIEGGAAALAAERRTEFDLLELARTHEEMAATFHSFSEPDMLVYSAADKRFHLALLNASHNEYLKTIFEAIYSILEVGIDRTSRTKVGRKASLKEHLDVIEAIRKKDSRNAQDKMLIHIENAKKYYFQNES